MEFTKEYWILESSLNCADESIPGGLKCFGIEHISGPCISALKEDLREICRGIIHNLAEHEKSEWSAKMTGVFVWKWLLSCKEFQFLQSMSNCNLKRFKDLNLNLCYEIIKSNRWANYFSDFLQAFNIGTYMDLLWHFLHGILASERFPCGREDVEFFVDFIHCTLVSISAEGESFKGTCHHPLVQGTQPHHGKEVTPQQTKKSIELFLNILTKILQTLEIHSDFDFQLKFLCITSFLNCLSVLLFDYVLLISSVDGVRPRVLTSERDKASEILTYEIVLLHLDGNCKHLDNTSLLSYVQSFLTLYSAFYKTAFDRFSEISNNLAVHFTGYTLLDVYSDIFIRAVGHLRNCSTYENINHGLKDGLATIYESLSPLSDIVSKVLEIKHLGSCNGEFKTKVALAGMETKSCDRQESFRLLLQHQINNEDLNLRKAKCLGLNADLIIDVDAFFGVLGFVTHLQSNFEITPNYEDVIKEMKMVLVKAYSQFDWSQRDEIIAQLNKNEIQKNAILEDTSYLKVKWKPYLNRLSNTDQGVKHEMSSIISLLFLENIEEVLMDILSEIVSNKRIIGVMAVILSQFPKTLNLPSKEFKNISMFCHSFLSIHCKTKDPKKNLAALVQLMVVGDDTSSKSGLLDFEMFSLACIFPATRKGLNVDLHLVELYLEVMKKVSTPISDCVKFVFFSIFNLLCTLLDMLHKSSFPSILAANLAKDESSFKWKDLFNQVINSWKDVFQRLFSEDSTFKILLCKKLKEFNWWTQDHFLFCLTEGDEPVLPPTLQQLKAQDGDKPFVPLEVPEMVECIKDLIEFIEISQFCLDYSFIHFNLKQVSLIRGNDVYNFFIQMVCQKFRLLTHSEWLRICSLLLELASSNDAQSNLDKALTVSHLLCDCMFLVKILQKKTEDEPIWAELPWERLCHYLKSFVKAFVKKEDDNGVHLEISRAFCQLCTIIPTELLVEVVEVLI